MYDLGLGANAGPCTTSGLGPNAAPCTTYWIRSQCRAMYDLGLGPNARPCTTYIIRSHSHRHGMWQMLRVHGVGGKLMKAVQSFYVDSRACLWVRNDVS